ncbi:uncharacterized protein MYCFIDRAFT_178096 [Pseudocercospora fijiensis CIRAD86]|uniref:Uncharacterized protein n=1 Tax=Pseudocercospora fijiensis (strain CIRAD86) TaxID=383855 RepID=M2YP22_PSEFD|nr:uncharacterized protein MYCFIDRAFT_178096 [Pseudocercospora fijiensis CIRAD86]EME79505.1 hypothetical protein MYCFIDRAFT_178096 [Pseudocercospora fijiensis CIRAD86]
MLSKINIIPEILQHLSTETIEKQEAISSTVFIRYTEEGQLAECFRAFYGPYGSKYLVMTTIACSRSTKHQDVGFLVGWSRQFSTGRTVVQAPHHGRTTSPYTSHRILPFFLSKSNSHLTHNRSCMMSHLCDAIKLDIFSNEVAADIQSKQQQFEDKEWCLTSGIELLNVVRNSRLLALIRKRESYEQAVEERLSEHARLWAEQKDLEKLAGLIKRRKASMTRQAYDAASKFSTSASIYVEDDDYEEYRNLLLYQKVRLRALFCQRLHEQEMDCKKSSDFYLNNRHRVSASESHNIPSIEQLRWKRTRLEIARRAYEVAVKEMLENTIAPILLLDETFPIYKLTTTNLEKIPDTVPITSPSSSIGSLFHDKQQGSRGQTCNKRLVVHYHHLFQPNASQAKKVHDLGKILETQERDLKNFQDEFFSAQLNFENLWMQERRSHVGFEERERDMLVEMEEIREEYLRERSRLREMMEDMYVSSTVGFGIWGSDERTAEACTPYAGIRKFVSVPPSDYCEEEAGLESSVEFEEWISNGNGSDYSETSRARKQMLIAPVCDNETLELWRIDVDEKVSVPIKLPRSCLKERPFEHLYVAMSLSLGLSLTSSHNLLFPPIPANLLT